jgi:hypothetical protein
MGEHKPMYKHLKRLGVPVYAVPVIHVKSSDIDRVLTPAQRNTFNELFGIQTCPVVDDRGELYPWDAEAVLVRMFDGKLTGSQLMWD